MARKTPTAATATTTTRRNMVVSSRSRAYIDEAIGAYQRSATADHEGAAELFEARVAADPAGDAD